MNFSEQNVRPTPDPELIALADYVVTQNTFSELAYNTACDCLMDALGCAMLALKYPACTRLLGPIIPGTQVPEGARVPGTQYELDPILAAFNIGILIRWLDYNDTWLAAEWGHPSDNLGALLSVADYQSRRNRAMHQPPLLIRDLLTALIKAYEIQGTLALENSFNRIGLDHVILVKIASAALSMQLLGGTQDNIITVLSHAFIDGHSLRTYRHSPNTGPRKSWAAGDAASRAVRLAWIVKQGEIICPSALSAKTWGFNAVYFQGRPLKFPPVLSSYVIENILFKIAFPAEFHAQTAVECALQLHPQIKDRIDSIQHILLTTQSPAIRIISKTGPLYNPADRDHCLQYMVAVALLFGDLTAAHYEDSIANDPRIDLLRNKMRVQENTDFNRDYLDPEKRAISNAIQIIFTDGSQSDYLQMDYPLGHRRRRLEARPLFIKKFKDNLSGVFSSEKIEELTELLLDRTRLEAMAVDEFIALLT